MFPIAKIQADEDLQGPETPTPSPFSFCKHSHTFFAWNYFSTVVLVILVYFAIPTVSVKHLLDLTFLAYYSMMLVINNLDIYCNQTHSKLITAAATLIPQRLFDIT